MDDLKNDFYHNVINNYDEYLKIVDICHNLSSIRINHLIKTFGGYNYENECYYNEFKNKNISYSIDIYCDRIDSTRLIIHSSKGYKDLEQLLMDEECIYGFNKSNDEDTLYRNFSFPKEEKKLFFITEKLIKIFKSKTMILSQ